MGLVHSPTGYSAGDPGTSTEMEYRLLHLGLHGNQVREQSQGQNGRRRTILGTRLTGSWPNQEQRTAELPSCSSWCPRYRLQLPGLTQWQMCCTYPRLPAILQHGRTLGYEDGDTDADMDDTGVEDDANLGDVPAWVRYSTASYLVQCPTWTWSWQKIGSFVSLGFG